MVLNLQTQIDEVVAAQNFGQPSAAKRGRNPAFPYVPVIVRPAGLSQTHNPHQGVAFATRDEAVAEAQRCIDQQRENLRQQLAQPRYRALRGQHGLPREI